MAVKGRSKCRPIQIRLGDIAVTGSHIPIYLKKDMASTIVTLKRALRKELKTTLGAVSKATIANECKWINMIVF